MISPHNKQMTMQLKPFVHFGAVLLIMASMVFSEDASGEWIAETTNRDGEIARIGFDFQVNGEKLTGSVLSYPEDEIPISDGKISGNKISFILKETIGSRTLSYMYTGRVSGDVIEFEIAELGSLGIPRRVKLNARRAKP